MNWIVFTSAVEGQGDGTVSYRINENSEPVNRQASISVADRQVALAQQGAPCRYNVAGPDAPVGPTGGQQSIQVSTHSACSWTAAADQPWASVSPTNGGGNATVRVTLAVNTGPARQTDVVVAGQRVTVSQNAAGTPPVPTPTAGPTPTPQPPGPTPTPTPQPPGPIPTPTPQPPGPIPTPTPQPPGPTPTPTPTPTPQPPGPTPTPTPTLTGPTPTPTKPPGPPPTPTPTPTPTPPAGPSPVKPIELSGPALSVSGSCGTATFQLLGQIVYTTNDTEFRGGPCRDLVNGKQVTVQGFVMSDGRIRADMIRF